MTAAAVSTAVVSSIVAAVMSVMMIMDGVAVVVIMAVRWVVSVAISPYPVIVFVIKPKSVVKSGSVPDVFFNIHIFTIFSLNSGASRHCMQRVC